MLSTVIDAIALESIDTKEVNPLIWVLALMKDVFGFVLEEGKTTWSIP